MIDCPRHPELGLECDRSEQHQLCMASTSQTTHDQSTYNAAWRRVWWRDGRPFASGRLHAQAFEALDDEYRT